MFLGITSKKYSNVKTSKITVSSSYDNGVHDNFTPPCPVLKVVATSGSPIELQGGRIYLIKYGPISCSTVIYTSLIRTSLKKLYLNILVFVFFIISRVTFFLLFVFLVLIFYLLDYLCSKSGLFCMLMPDCRTHSYFSCVSVVWNINKKDLVLCFNCMCIQSINKKTLM